MQHTWRSTAAGAVMLVLLGVLASLLTALAAPGIASAAPGIEESKTSAGAAVRELVPKEIKTLCPDGADTSTDPSADPSAEPSTPSSSGTPADNSGLAGEGCSDKDPGLWEAAATCSKDGKLDTKAKLDDITDSQSKKFLECMAKAGYGEKPKDEPETPEAAAEKEKMSLAAVTGSLTAFYINELSPETADGEPADTPAPDAAGETATAPTAGLDAWAYFLNSPSIAGGFVGAIDKTKGQSNGWIFNTGDAENSATVNYSAFSRNLNPRGALGQPLGPGKVGSAVPTGLNGQVVADGGVQAYMLYGAALNGLGLDASLSTSGLGGRSLPGGLMMVGLFGAGSVDALFDTAIGALQWLNPFRFVFDWVGQGSGSSTTAGMDSTSDQESRLAGVRDLFGGLYNKLTTIGWALVMPIFLGSLMFSLVMLKKANHSSNIKKFIVRIAFLAIGLPLLGGMYTAALGSMAGASASGGKAAASKVVLSTYVDFEAWMNTSRLEPAVVGSDTNPIRWDTESNAPASESEALARRFALQVNTNSNEALKGLSTDTADAASNDASWASQMTGLDASAAWDSADVWWASMDMLKRFTTGDTVGSGAFESQVKNVLYRSYGTGAPDAAERKSAVNEWFTELIDPTALASLTGNDVQQMYNPIVGVTDGLQVRLPGDGKVLEFRPGDTKADCPMITEESQGLANGILNKAWDPRAPETAMVTCNLSPAAAYNYLNTDFGPKKMTIFSASANQNARTAHASVTSVGSGVSQFVYWLSAMSMLAAFALIGFIYALGMVLSSIKRAVHLIGAALGTTVGSLASVSKVVVYTVALFLELFCTIVLYKLMQAIIMVVPTVLEQPLIKALSDPEVAKGTAAVGAGVLAIGGPKGAAVIALIVTVVSTALLLIFLVMAITSRRSMLDAFDQAITGIVNKFVETNVSSGMDPGQPGAMRQGLARGGTMAMTSMMMSGHGSGDPTAAVDAVTDGGGGDIGAGGPGSSMGAYSGNDAPGTSTGVMGGTGVPGANGAAGGLGVGADGTITGAGGAPISSGGSNLRLGDMVPIDSASGHITDGAGQSITGADGSPLSADNVGGFDAQGRMLDNDGAVLTDQGGNALESEAARRTSLSQMSDQVIAQNVANSGLSQYAQGAGAPVAGTPAPAPSAPAPEPAPSSGSTDSGSKVGKIAGSVAVSTMMSRLGQPRKQGGTDYRGGGGKGK